MAPTTILAMHDPAAQAAALSAHARQGVHAETTVRRAAEMGALRKGRPEIPDFRPAILAAAKATPQTLKELSRASGVRLPHARKTVERLSSSGELRNLAKRGQIGLWVLGTRGVKS